MDRSEHWNKVYANKRVDEVSWYQPEARVSLELVEACQLAKTAPLLDVGAGASTLVDGLLGRGYCDVTLLDIAAASLAATRQRLPDAPIHYEVGDVTSWQPQRAYRLWHDRAVYHFLTDPKDRHAYREVLAAAVPAGGYAILATFALDGPERCSGLAVQRYSADTLASEFAGVLRPLEQRAHRHVTPAGAEQSFVFVRFERV